MKKTLTTLAVSLSLATISTISQADTLIYAGNAFTSTSNELLSDVTIVVDDNKIEAIKEGFVKAEEGDTVIDLKHATVMPGLMDMHVHLSSQHGGPQTYLDRFSLN